jgi:hypothetical protein
MRDTSEDWLSRTIRMVEAVIERHGFEENVAQEIAPSVRRSSDAGWVGSCKRFALLRFSCIRRNRRRHSAMAMTIKACRALTVFNRDCDPFNFYWGFFAQVSCRWTKLVIVETSLLHNLPEHSREIRRQFVTKTRRFWAVLGIRKTEKQGS